MLAIFSTLQLVRTSWIVPVGLNRQRLRNANSIGRVGVFGNKMMLVCAVPACSATKSIAQSGALAQRVQGVDRPYNFFTQGSWAREILGVSK